MGLNPSNKNKKPSRCSSRGGGGGETIKKPSRRRRRNRPTRKPRRLERVKVPGKRWQQRSKLRRQQRRNKLRRIHLVLVMKHQLMYQMMHQPMHHLRRKDTILDLKLGATYYSSADHFGDRLCHHICPGEQIQAPR